MDTKTATLQNIKEWVKNGCVVCAYPRKGIIVVNGFRRYIADKQACNAVKEANKIKLTS